MVQRPSRRSRSYFHALKHVESLEARTLMSITPTVATVPGVYGDNAAYDSNGHLWVVNSGDNGLELDDLNGTAAYDISSINFNNSFVIANGHAYLSDSGTGVGGGIDDVNLSTGQLTYTQLTNDYNQVPLHLAVTGNAIWFTAPGTYDVGTDMFTNYVGRWVPGSASAQYLTLDSSFGDAQLASISGDGADKAWVAVDGTDDGTLSGANRVLAVSYNGAFSTTTYAANSGNTVADQNNQLDDVVADGSGGAWYVLAQTPPQPATLRTQHGAETIVHITGSGQVGYPVTTDPNALLNVRDLSLSNGRLWFDELNGPQAGYLNTATGQFDMVNYPDGTENPFGLAASPDGGTATVLTAPSTDSDVGNPIITLTVDTQQVTFSGTAYDQMAQEKTAITGTLLATFTAPDLPSGQHYTATVTWGDNTSSVITATSLGDNSFALVVGSKTFASQGNYAGTISIKDPSNALVGTLTFTSRISDVPLDITSFNVTPLILRIATVTSTFTDDPGLAASTFTATINWGDGTHSTGLVVRNPLDPGQYIIIGVHQYSHKGTYTVQLTVTTTEQNAAIEDNTATASVKV